MRNIREYKKKEALNILYQSDQNTQVALGTSIASLLLNNRLCNDINIYLIDDGIDSFFCSQLTKYIESLHGKLVVIPSDILLKNKLVKNFACYKGERKNKHSYLKLFWDIAIVNNMDKLLYIDCDTIIKDDLTELFTFDMGDNYIGMVLDALITDEIQYIGLDSTKPYFNSGVILFDCKKWIENKCSKRTAFHKIQYGTVDQDLINVEFKDKIAILPMKYNYQLIHKIVNSQEYRKEFQRENYYTQKEIESAEKNACIIHFLKFIGQNPWDKGNLHPCRYIFEEYFEQTPWKLSLIHI